MAADGAVLLLATALTVIVIAGYLIAISLILRRVFGKLETILGAVSAVVDKTAGAGQVIEAINKDLATGHAALGGAVERLKERTGSDPEESEAGPQPASPAGSSRWFQR